MTRTAHNTGSRRASATVKIMVAVAGLGIVGFGGWVALRAGGATDNASARVKAVDYAEVRIMDVDITTVSTGEIEAKNRIEIRSKLDTESSIVEIVREGTIAAKGDLLVQLNGNQLQEAIERERIDVVAAQAEFVAAENDYKNQIEENLSSLRKAELKVTLAELALEQWIDGETKKKYEELKLAIERADRDYDRQRDKYAKSKELYAQGFLSLNELVLDEIAYIEALSRWETTRFDEEIYWTYQYPKDREQKNSDVTEAKAELDRVVRSNEIALVGKHANLESRRQRLSLREDRLAKLEQQLEFCRIYSPTSGLVVYATSMEEYWDRQGRGAMEIGRVVSPNDLIIVLPDISEMLAKVRVHETLAGRVRPGQPATVKVDALGGVTFTGTVQSVGVLAESTNWRDPNRREYTVRIAIDNAPGFEQLKPSMRCETVIRLARLEQVKAVPVQAVFSEGPVRFVYVPRGARYARVPVQIGQTSDMHAQIIAGVEPGQRVLLRRPAAGEVIDEPWDEAQLRLVGLKFNERGEPEQMQGVGGPGGPPRGAPNRQPTSSAPTTKPANSETSVAQSIDSATTNPTTTEPTTTSPTSTN